jgi:hypothetical protein
MVLQFIHLVFLLHSLPILIESTKITSGYTLHQKSTDYIFESYAILNFHVPTPDYPCGLINPYHDDNSNFSNNELRLLAAYQVFLQQVTTSCKQHRIKRQHYNPLAYVGWVQSRIFGLAHAFDLEQVNSRVDNAMEFIDTLKKNLNLVNSALLSQSAGLKVFEDDVNQKFLQIHQGLKDLKNN